MFRNAIAVSRQYTQPVILSRRASSGKCSSSIGSFVVINDEGWIVTAGHIIEQIKKLNDETLEARDREQREAAIRNDSGLDLKERRRQLVKLGRPKDDATDRYSVVWGQYPGAQLVDAAFLQAVDLGIGRLDPFIPGLIKSYPLFKDPSKDFEQGTSLCKLGFPFHYITPSWDDRQGQFTIPPESLNLAMFPMEGIFTRTQILQVPLGSPLPKYPLMRVETSSPGLRGQSGGPIFDTKGTIWAIQCNTQHLPLGFDPPVPGSKRGEKEHQFLNLGLGVHPETIFGLLRERGVNNFQISPY